jgi:integrase
VPKPATRPTLRHWYATHPLQGGSDIGTMQALRGHLGVTTTMICTHVISLGGMAVCSPLDRLTTAQQAVGVNDR